MLPPELAPNRNKGVVGEIDLTRHDNTVKVRQREEQEEKQGQRVSGGDWNKQLERRQKVDVEAAAGFAAGRMRLLLDAADAARRVACNTGHDVAVVYACMQQQRITVARHGQYCCGEEAQGQNAACSGKQQSLPHKQQHQQQGDTWCHSDQAHQSLYHLHSTALTGLMSPFPVLYLQHLNSIQHAGIAKIPPTKIVEYVYPYVEWHSWGNSAVGKRHTCNLTLSFRQKRRAHKPVQQSVPRDARRTTNFSVFQCFRTRAPPVTVTHRETGPVSLTRIPCPCSPAQPRRTPPPQEFSRWSSPRVSRTCRQSRMCGVIS